MNYKDLLNRTINKAEMRNVDLIEALKERGISITPNYLSVMRNNAEKIPSNEISRAIAEICGEPTELLVIQGDLDRLEGGLKDYVDFTVKSAFNSAELGIKMYCTKEHLDKLHSMCEADFICDYINNPDNYKTEIDRLLEGIQKGLHQNKENHKWALVPLANDKEIKIVDDIKEVITQD